MAITFQKAKREKIWTKVLLTGPSGSGKTYSALRLATGLAGECGSDIAYIDTENNRSLYYANEFDFSQAPLEEPYEPRKYIDAIQSAIDAGFKVVVIDSLSHEWLWCNDTVNNMAGNSFQSWGKVKTKFHFPFMEYILQSPCHIIATARGKDKWTLDEKDGKKTPRKVGEGSVQSDDTEYNYTVTFNLAQDSHIATCTKDNTHIFEDRFAVLTEADGKRIYEWANTGEVPAPKKVVSAIQTPSEIEQKQNELKETIDVVLKKGVAKSLIANILKTECGTAKYTTIIEPEILQKGIDALVNMEVS